MYSMLSSFSSRENVHVLYSMYPPFCKSRAAESSISR